MEEITKKYLTKMEKYGRIILNKGKEGVEKMSFKEMMLKQKGMWLVTTSDKSKWVIDLDNMLFDNYEWYKAMGTLESELENLDNLLKGNTAIKKIK